MQALVRIARGDEDLVQDALVKALSGGRFDPTQGSVVQYVAIGMRMVRGRRNRDAMRLKRRALHVAFDDARDGGVDPIESRIDAERILLGQATGLLRDLLEGYSQVELAEREGITRQGMSLRVKKLRAAL